MSARGVLYRLPLAVLSAIASLATAAVFATPAVADDGSLGQLVPVDAAEYLSSDPHYRGTVFFQAPDGRDCAIYFNDGGAGCDAVPADAPQGTNQVRTSGYEIARYTVSATPTYTYPAGAKVLPEGHKITWSNATCGVGLQGTITCDVGDHGFTIAATYGVLY
ncbi:hypothetical protein OHA40_09655 [Nocardia sp. NBC_00508]|uniref:hypothetical protein n=1 Tax=Nocardia sp. NBC_00508 TaxID=2975992 RepID=UPI002E811897|nr:hypothetical protein [Nocardia sp. NBC_00508]WUD68345.1 hypothetical protein OHA40_09655 [Nocardia sp. NBC_00508]